MAASCARRIRTRASPASTPRSRWRRRAWRRCSPARMSKRTASAPCPASCAAPPRRARGRLPYPRDMRRRACGVHQHHTDRALPRGRASGGSTRDRTRHRSRGARARDRSGRAAPAQPDPSRGDAVPDRTRLPLRLRRVRRQPRKPVPPSPLDAPAQPASAFSTSNRVSIADHRSRSTMRMYSWNDTPLPTSSRRSLLRSSSASCIVRVMRISSVMP